MSKSKPNRFQKRKTAPSLTGLQAVANAPAAGTLTELPLEIIRPDPNQPRQHFDERSLQELSDSIKARGVLQPIRVRPQGESFEIISGERRYRAAEKAGLASIPVVVESREDYTDLDQAIDALVENLQRDDLNVVDEVEGIFQLIRMRAEAEHGQDVAEELDYAGVERALNRMRNAKSEEFVGVEASIARIAEELGLSWKTLAVKKASVWRWPEDVLQALRNRLISLDVASVLKTVKDEEVRTKWLQSAIDEGFSASTLRARLKTARLLQRPAIESRVPALRLRLETLLTEMEKLPATETDFATLEQFEKLEDVVSALERILETAR